MNPIFSVLFRPWPICLTLLLIWFSFQPAWAAVEQLPSGDTYTVSHDLNTPFQVAAGDTETAATPLRFCGESCWSWSFLLPGLGQLFQGQYQRGFWFLAGFSVLPLLITLGPLLILETLQIPGWHGEALQPVSPFLALIAGLTMVTVYVWSLFDAHFIQFSADSKLALRWRGDALILSLRY